MAPNPINLQGLLEPLGTGPIAADMTTMLDSCKTLCFSYASRNLGPPGGYGNRDWATSCQIPVAISPGRPQATVCEPGPAQVPQETQDAPEAP